MGREWWKKWQQYSHKKYSKFQRLNKKHYFILFSDLLVWNQWLWLDYHNSLQKQSYFLGFSLRHKFHGELYFGGICFTRLLPEQLHENRRVLLFIWWDVLISLKCLYFVFEPTYHLEAKYVRKKMNCFITFCWAAALLNRKDVSKHPDRRENTLSPHWRWYNKGFRLFMQVKNLIWGEKIVCSIVSFFVFYVKNSGERETTGGVRWGLQEIWENVSKRKSNRRMNNGMDKNVTIIITFHARWNQNMGWLELLCLEIN